MKRILLAGAAFAALTSASLAADMAIEPVTGDWSGFYAGIQGGYAWSDEVIIDDDTTDFEPEGGFGGLYYGRNWQSGNWVYGLDGSVSFASIESDIGGGESIEIQGFSASRLRVGYAFDNFMIFAAGGFSLAKVEVQDDPESDDFWALGFTVGAGVEAKLSDNWSARVEYLYLDYGDEDANVGGPDINVEVNDVHAIRGGVAYHF